MIISFANQKGGVGKTTCTYNVGYALSKLNRKVLLIDFDPQASLTISLGYDPTEFKYFISDCLSNEKFDIKHTIQKKQNNLYFIPSIINLAKEEMTILSKMNRESILKRIIEPIKKEYDYILIDCPPQLSLLTINAIVASDKVIIPTRTDYLSYRGLEQLQDTIREIQELINPKIEVLGVIANLYEKNVKNDNEVLKHLIKNFTVLGVINKRVAFQDSIYDGSSIIEKQPILDVSEEFNKIAKQIDSLKEWK